MFFKCLYFKKRVLVFVLVAIAMTFTACHVKMEVEFLWPGGTEAEEAAPSSIEKKTAQPEPEKSPKATGGLNLSVSRSEKSAVVEVQRIRRTDKVYRPATRKLDWFRHSPTQKGQQNLSQCVTGKPDGGCVEAGQFTERIVFSLGSGSQTTLVSQSGYDTYIASYDDDGEFEWASSVNSRGHMYPVEISVADDGTVYLLGSYIDNVSFTQNAYKTITLKGSDKLRNAYLAAYSEEGELLWANNIHHVLGGRVVGDRVCDAIASTPDNGCLMAGSFINAIDFSSQAGEGKRHTTNSIEETAYIAKYDRSGRLEWTRFLEGSWDSCLKDLAVLPSGDFYAVGGFIHDFTMTTPMDEIKRVQVNEMGRSHLILLCNSDGLAKTINIQKNADSYALLNAVTPLPGGDVVISGIYKGRQELNTKPEPVMLQHGSGSMQTCYMARMAPDGAILWYNIFETSSKRITAINGMQHLGPDGNIYALIRSDGDMTIKNGPEEIFVPQKKARASVVVTSPEGDVLDCWQVGSDPGTLLYGLSPVAGHDGFYLSGQFSKDVVIEDDYENREVLSTDAGRERLLLRFELK